MLPTAGWRDFVLPRLQHRYGAVDGTVVPGLARGARHLPVFLTTWSSDRPPVPWPTIVALIASAVLVVATRGRLGPEVSGDLDR